MARAVPVTAYQLEPLQKEGVNHGDTTHDTWQDWGAEPFAAVLGNRWRMEILFPVLIESLKMPCLVVLTHVFIPGPVQLPRDAVLVSGTLCNAIWSACPTSVCGRDCSRRPYWIELMNVMLFYKNVAGLSREAHRSLHLDRRLDFRFASRTHWIPVSGSEFYRASRHYPIVFIKEGEQYSPVILVGLEAGRNDFVDAGGQWKKDCYIPAFVRRYPFILARTGAEEPLPDGHPLTVCIDTDFAGWSDREGEALFTQEGTNTPYLNAMVQFLDGFTAGMQRTQAFTGDLARLNLLVKRSLTVERTDGRTFTLNDVYIVDEKQFSRLYGQELIRFNQPGVLGWVFAHLMSLENLLSMFNGSAISQDISQVH